MIRKSSNRLSGQIVLARRDRMGSGFGNRAGPRQVMWFPTGQASRAISRNAPLPSEGHANQTFVSFAAATTFCSNGASRISSSLPRGPRATDRDSHPWRDSALLESRRSATPLREPNSRLGDETSIQSVVRNFPTPRTNHLRAANCCPAKQFVRRSAQTAQGPTADRLGFDAIHSRGHQTHWAASQR